MFLPLLLLVQFHFVQTVKSADTVVLCYSQARELDLKYLMTGLLSETEKQSAIVFVDLVVVVYFDLSDLVRLLVISSDLKLEPFAVIPELPPPAVLSQKHLPREGFGSQADHLPLFLSHIQNSPFQQSNQPAVKYFLRSIPGMQ